MGYRISVDTGGTFTDMVVLDQDGEFYVGKALTTPDRISEGMFNALEVVAEHFGTTPTDMLAATDLVIYGTTRATNAIVTKQTARTAFLTTTVFPDVLVFKEGG